MEFCGQALELAQLTLALMNPAQRGALGGITLLMDEPAEFKRLVERHPGMGPVELATMPQVGQAVRSAALLLITVEAWLGHAHQSSSKAAAPESQEWTAGESTEEERWPPLPLSAQQWEPLPTIVPERKGKPKSHKPVSKGKGAKS